MTKHTLELFLFATLISEVIPYRIAMIEYFPTVADPLAINLSYSGLDYNRV